MVCRPNSSMRWTVCLRPAVHLRPSMENFYGPSSESVHEMDSPSVRPSIRPAVHLRPPAMNYHGPSSKSVHEVDCPWVDGP